MVAAAVDTQTHRMSKCVCVCCVLVSLLAVAKNGERAERAFVFTECVCSLAG